MDFPLYSKIFNCRGRINFLEINPYIFSLRSNFSHKISMQATKVKTTIYNYHPPAIIRDHFSYLQTYINKSNANFDFNFWWYM